MGTMTPDELALLRELKQTADQPDGFAMACDGKDRAKAHALEKIGLADWKGTSWGSSFWAITEEGQKLLAELPQPEPVA